MYARVESPGFFILIEQNEEQPGGKDLEGVEELIGCEGDGEFVRFFIIDQGMEAGIGENGRREIDEQVRVVRREEGGNQNGNHNTDRPHEGVLDEGGDVIIGVLFLGGLGGKFHVPPGALFEVGKDTLEVIIGDEMREEHEEKEKKFDRHNHSPALPAAALFADLFCLIGQSAIMHAADTVEIVGIDLNFFILEDMLPPDTFGIGTINVMFPCKH